MNEQVAAQGKENGLLWLEGYEKVPQDLLDLEEDAAKGNRRGLGYQVGHHRANVVRQTSVVFFQLLNGHLES